MGNGFNQYIGSDSSFLRNRSTDKIPLFRQEMNRVLLVLGVWIQELDSCYQLKEIQIHPDFQNQGIEKKILGSKINSMRFEPPWYAIRMPGGVGGEA